MKFFLTSEGQPHIFRIGGLLSVIIAAIWCRECVAEPAATRSALAEPLCFMNSIFAAGWWLVGGSKRPVRTWSEMAHPLRIIGVILILVSLAGQFYFPGHR
jgi:hypothetical protein